MKLRVSTAIRLPKRATTRHSDNTLVIAGYESDCNEHRMIGVNYLDQPYSMSNKTYLIRFKPPEIGFGLVTAARAEIHGEHLVLLREDGSLCALFVLEIVESWSELEMHSA